MLERYEALNQLVGEEINAIAFVMNFVEVHFNGPILTCYTPPILECRGRTFVFPHEGSRDALCGLIGDIPYEACEDVESAIVLKMNTGCVLTIRLDRDSTMGREAATLIGVSETTFVW